MISTMNCTSTRTWCQDRAPASQLKNQTSKLQRNKPQNLRPRLRPNRRSKNRTSRSLNKRARKNLIARMLRSVATWQLMITPSCSCPLTPIPLTQTSSQKSCNSLETTTSALVEFVESARTEWRIRHRLIQRTLSKLSCRDNNYKNPLSSNSLLSSNRMLASNKMLTRWRLKINRPRLHGTRSLLASRLPSKRRLTRRSNKRILWRHMSPSRWARKKWTFRSN
jgi:hypothetical protein